MNKNFIKIIGLIFISISFFACSKAEVEETKGIDAIQKEKGIPVSIQKSAKLKVSDVRKYSGGISGYIQKDVYAAVPEVITQVNAKIGQSVRKGKVIIALDAKTGNSPQYRQAKVQYETIKTTYERMQKVHEKGGISQQQLDEVKAQYDAAEAGMHAVSKMNYVESPISGVITKMDVKLGQSAPFGDGAPPMFQVAQISKVIMTIAVSSNEINYFKKNMPATIVLNGQTIVGKIKSVPLAANMMTRMFMVEVQFKNKDKLLKPGMFLETEIAVKTVEDIAIPIESIFLHQNKPHIYVIENNKAKLKEITPLLYGESHVIVGKSISENIDVVINGMNLLSNNAKVTVIK